MVIKKITKGIVLAILAALIVVLFIKLDTLTKEPAFIGADTAANGNVNLSILPYTCYMNITMYSGWNLISIKCEQSNEALTTVLAPISGNYTAVEAFWANDTGDPWKKYDPAVPPFINDLNSVDHVHGYWVNMSLPDTLEINGTISYRTNILQLAGWNLPGYPATIIRGVTTALSSINGNYTAVEAYYANDSGDPWKKYDPAVPPFVNDLSSIDPGFGYWINTTVNDTWEVYAW